MIRELHDNQQGSNELDQRMAINSMLTFNEDGQLEKRALISVKSGEEIYHCQAKHLDGDIENIEMRCVLTE